MNSAIEMKQTIKLEIYTDPRSEIPCGVELAWIGCERNLRNKNESYYFLSQLQKHFQTFSNIFLIFGRWMSPQMTTAKTFLGEKERGKVE